MERKAPREPGAGDRHRLLRATSATAYGRLESCRTSLRGEGVSVSFLSSPCSQRTQKSCNVRCLFTLTASWRTARALHRRSRLGVHQLPLWPGQAGQAGSATCRPGDARSRHATRRTRLRAHASSTPGEAAGALLLPSRWRVSGCFYFTALSDGTWTSEGRIEVSQNST